MIDFYGIEIKDDELKGGEYGMEDYKRDMEYLIKQIKKRRERKERVFFKEESFGKKREGVKKKKRVFQNNVDEKLKKMINR